MNNNEYYVYWHPDNDVPAGVENPLKVKSSETIFNQINADVQETLNLLYPGIQDFIITTDKCDEETEKVIFDGFKLHGQAKDYDKQGNCDKCGKWHPESHPSYLVSHQDWHLWLPYRVRS